MSTKVVPQSGNLQSELSWLCSEQKNLGENVLIKMKKIAIAFSLEKKKQNTHDIHSSRTLPKTEAYHGSGKRLILPVQLFLLVPMSNSVVSGSKKKCARIPLMLCP